MDGSLYFAGVAGANVALYRSDGTPAGTSVVDYAYHAGGSDPGPITAAGDRFYFSAYDGIYGRELWVSDGSLEGTRQVKDIRTGISSSSPTLLTVLSDTLYFQACDDAGGCELWTTDGTPQGTIRLKDIYPGVRGSSPQFLTVLNSLIYFAAEDDTHGRELWRTDGTPDGTQMVVDTVPGLASGAPYDLAVMNDTLYFRLNDGVHGLELLRSDGTPAGTNMVKDIGPNGNSYPAHMTVFAGRLVFRLMTGRMARNYGKVTARVPARAGQRYQTRRRPIRAVRIRALWRLALLRSR